MAVKIRMVFFLISIKKYFLVLQNGHWEIQKLPPSAGQCQLENSLICMRKFGGSNCIKECQKFIGAEAIFIRNDGQDGIFTGNELPNRHRCFCSGACVPNLFGWPSIKCECKNPTCNCNH